MTSFHFQPTLDGCSYLFVRLKLLAGPNTLFPGQCTVYAKENTQFTLAGGPLSVPFDNENYCAAFYPCQTLSIPPSWAQCDTN